MSYVNKRHIVSEKLSGETPRDFPDMESVQIPNYQLIKPTASDKNINVNVKEVEQRRREVSMMRKTQIESQVKGNQQKVKSYYESYIKELENENQRLKGVEMQYVQMNEQKRKLQMEIEEIQSILNVQVGAGATEEMVEDLRRRIELLNQEKMELINLIDMNKTEIRELNQQIVNVQDFGNKNVMLRRISELENTLRNVKCQEITRDKVVWVDKPVYKDVESKKQAFHCVMMVGDMVKGDRKSFVYNPVKVQQKQVKVQQKPVQIKQKPVRTRHVQQTKRVVQQPQQEYQIIEKPRQQIRQQTVRKPTRSRSQRRYVMDLVNNRQKFFEDNVNT